MSLSRSLRRLQQKNRHAAARRQQALFEQLEPRLILSADQVSALTPQLDPQGLPADGGVVCTSEASNPPPGIASGLPGATAETESNNSRILANFLPLTEDPALSGLWLGRGSGRQDPATNQTYESDPDYWRFEALAGDIVSVSVDTPASNLDTYVWLRSAADTVLAEDNNQGPDNDAFISHYTIPSSGSYYIEVGKYYYETTPGDYTLRLELARGIQQETDDNYRNDSIGNANGLTMTPGGTHLRATVAGAVMGPESSNTDEDYFALGLLNVGNTVELNLRTP